jgi:hypothetical protein
VGLVFPRGRIIHNRSRLDKQLRNQLRSGLHRMRWWGEIAALRALRKGPVLQDPGPYRMCGEEAISMGGNYKWGDHPSPDGGHEKRNTCSFSFAPPTLAFRLQTLGGSLSPDSTAEWPLPLRSIEPPRPLTGVTRMAAKRGGPTLPVPFSSNSSFLKPAAGDDCNSRAPGW